MGDLLGSPAAVLLAGERAGDRPAGVGHPAPEAPAVPAHRVLAAQPLLGLRAARPAQVQPARLLPEVPARPSTQCRRSPRGFGGFQRFKSVLSAMQKKEQIKLNMFVYLTKKRFLLA